MPAGYTGCMLRGKVGENGLDKEWEVERSFDKISYWNHETAPTKTDNLCRCWEWLELSKEVGPVYVSTFILMSVILNNQIKIAGKAHI